MKIYTVGQKLYVHKKWRQKVEAKFIKRRQKDITNGKKAKHKNIGTQKLKENKEKIMQE